MDSKEVKLRLEDDDNIEKLLEEVGCEHIKREQRGGLVTAQLPDSFGSDNKRAVQVYSTEHLSAKIRNMPEFSGDIFSLVAFLKFKADAKELQSMFKKSIDFVTEFFGWGSSSDSYTRKKDFVAPLKTLASKSRNFKQRVPNKVISEDVLKDFKMIADHGWYLEGISLATQYFYQIGFDYLTHRISIPIRNENGELVGVKGRLIKNSDVDDYNPKYNYMYRCNISQEWFNMYVAREHIIREKKVYIFESEKSVMKLHSNGVYNAVAISSSDITPVQVSMIKNLGLDIDIVLCYDKDKGVDEVKFHAKKFTHRDTYAILDLENLLGEKDAPVDKGHEVWEYLLENHCYLVTAERE